MKVAFESLTSRLQSVFQRLRGKGKLDEKEVTAALREVRLALLEADVNFRVVKDFAARVQERAIGQEVLQSLTPAQQVIKIVHQELTNLMGQTHSRIELAPKPPTVLMVVGLQGSGKTTTVVKLARYLQKQGRSPLLVAADIYRPAAIKQLTVLGEQISVPVFSMGQGTSPVDISRAAVRQAIAQGRDVVLIDTAGRLHIDEDLMQELEAIKAAVNPQEILLVVDAMTGQDAVQVAETFNARLSVAGVILTKLDGDTRGGAALSVRAVTGRPIKFIGVGEKLDALEQFHPERMASRVLGMGDMMTLIEKAESAFDAQQAREMEKKLRTNEFTLEDFLEQIKQMKKMGPLEEILGMIPGFNKMKQLKNLQVDEREMVKTEAMIKSMTVRERRDPGIIDGSRRRRIARGSGTRVQDVNRLLKQFEQTRKMIKQFVGKDKGKRRLPQMPF
jgi:signal recognition particle subunit SRP54